MDKNQFGISSGNYFGGYENRDHIDGYPHLLEAMQDRISAAINAGKKLFTTDAVLLYDAYLNNIPAYNRQYYRCHSCERFIETYGNLVTISENGIIESVLWNMQDAPAYFKDSVMAMQTIVSRANVTGIFVPDSTKLGTPLAGGFTHFAVTVPQSMVKHSKLQSASQLMAEKREEYKMISRAVADFSLNVVEKAVQLLQSEALYRAEKNVDKARWFKELLEKRLNVKNPKARKNITWSALANAPIGFAHIRSGSLGVLLESIASGLSFEAINRKMKEIMDPLQYQRPQAAPKAGNINQAEKVVQQLGIEKSLVRRFARLEELNLLWKPQAKKNEVKDGVFGHLYESKPKAKMDITAVTTMTWRKFAETVLPFAEEIEYQVKQGNDNFSAILTAYHQDAPPILQWDNENLRNPFSWYVYSNGSPAHKWGLSPGYRKVTGITFQPSMWYGDYPNQGKSVYLLIEGAKDSGYRGAGNALFPETLKSELREVRSTIEAYSRKATIEGFYQASANGIRLQAGSSWNAVVRVTTKTGTAVYKLDRWD